VGGEFDAGTFEARGNEARQVGPPVDLGTQETASGGAARFRADAEALPSGADRAARARSVTEPAGPPAGDWPIVVLQANREMVLPRPVHGVVLQLAPSRSEPALPAGLAWLRVRDAAGRRELREQQFGAPGSPTELRVPAAWLEPGSYRAAIVAGDEARPLASAEFRVEP
jgi:hypothetical protein